MANWATTTFDSLPLGIINAIPLATPAGVTSAVLMGRMEVKASPAPWPDVFHEKHIVLLDGAVDIMQMGALDMIAPAFGITNANSPNPSVEFDVLNYGDGQLHKARGIALLNGATLPGTFANFGTGTFHGTYGFGKLRGEVVGQITLQSGT